MLLVSGCSAVGSAPALGAGCREFESRHLDHSAKDYLCGKLWLNFYMADLYWRHSANKAGFLLWAKTLCAAGGRYSRAFCVQRSIKSRISVSPQILSGTANRRRSRGCREFESRHLDHLPMESWIHSSVGFFVFYDRNMNLCMI